MECEGCSACHLWVQWTRKFVFDYCLSFVIKSKHSASLFPWNFDIPNNWNGRMNTIAMSLPLRIIITQIFTHSTADYAWHIKYHTHARYVSQCVCVCVCDFSTLSVMLGSIKKMFIFRYQTRTQYQRQSYWRTYSLATLKPTLYPKTLNITIQALAEIIPNLN